MFELKGTTNVASEVLSRAATLARTGYRVRQASGEAGEIWTAGCPGHCFPVIVCAGWNHSAEVRAHHS